MKNEWDSLDPFNLGNERYRVWVTIRDEFVGIVGAQGIGGRIVKIPLIVGPNKLQWIPNGNKIGIWTKGRPANIEFERIPPELKIVDIDHIQKILIDINQFG